VRRLIWIVCTLLLLANFAIVVLLTEFAMHPPRMRHNEDVALPAHNIAESTDSTATLVSIRAPDGTALKAWWFWPHTGATRAVIVCHGIADSAMGSIGFAPLFLKNGYAVLVPESRGRLAWVKQQGPTTFYGLGESLGGAILLQSLAHGADFRAVIAESSYASFEEIADDRIGKTLGPVLAPLIVREAMLYARLRYHVDLSQASPAAAIAHSHVPILLIHGLADNETPPKHSQEMAKTNPAVQLWLVPNAIHTGAYFADPKGFESRILSTFQPAP
jgi:dienelactone hydrolase